VIDISEENIIKVSVPQHRKLFPTNIYGIDIGFTLTKFAFFDGKDLILELKPTVLAEKDIENKCNELLEKRFKLNLTGGGSFKLYNLIREKGHVTLCKEFVANALGCKGLIDFQEGSVTPGPIVVSIGTGTSVVLGYDEIRHLGGTALGGAYFMGLIKALFNITDYNEALSLAKSGNRFNVDLKVADIYDKDDDRVDPLFREMTAASYGKLAANAKKEDFIQSLLWMLGENIGTISCLFANSEKVSSIIFCGGFLRDNRILKRVLKMICRFHKKHVSFLKYPEFMGAVGAMIYGEDK
jgi:type II pantothenate kinase